MLGAIILDNKMLNRAIELLKPDHFFSVAHQRIFQCMTEMSEPIDLITLTAALRRKDELEVAHGAVYLSTLIDGVPRISNLEHYAGIVKEKALLRGLIYAADAIREAAFEEQTSAAIIDDLRAKADVIASSEKHKVTIYTPAQLTAMISEAVEIIAFPIAVRGMVALLDGAPKSAGKTTFLLTAARACFRKDPFLNHATKRVPTLYVTEENPRTMKAALQRADLCDATELHILPANLTGMCWLQLARQIEQLCAQLKIGWLVVDTFYAIAGLTGDDENKAGAASQALAPLRRIAGVLDCAVSLGRHTRKMGGNIGESGRGSSALTGDADIICELKRLPGSHKIQRRQLEFTGRIEPGGFEIELCNGKYRIADEPAEETDETGTLVAVLGVDPKVSVRQLSQVTGIGRNRIPKLLAKAGWTYGDDGWRRVARA